MIPEFRLSIVGHKVTSIDRDSFGFGICLDGGWSIRIHAPTELTLTAEVPSIDRLLGATLVSLVGDEFHELLTFGNGVELDVDLHGEGRAESMVLHGPNDLVVVWQ